MKSELTTSNGVRLIPVTPGSFLMGSPRSEVGRAYWEGEREVTLSHEFYLGAAPVTQRQFELVMPGFPRQLAHHPTAAAAPVDSVPWKSATEFCGKLTAIDRDAGILSDDWEYRLPTETEWEYACRAGNSDATYGPLDSSGYARLLSPGQVAICTRAGTTSTASPQTSWSFCTGRRRRFSSWIAERHCLGGGKQTHGYRL